MKNTLTRYVTFRVVWSMKKPFITICGDSTNSFLKLISPNVYCLDMVVSWYRLLSVHTAHKALSEVSSVSLLLCNQAATSMFSTGNICISWIQVLLVGNNNKMDRVEKKSIPFSKLYLPLRWASHVHSNLNYDMCDSPWKQHCDQF